MGTEIFGSNIEDMILDLETDLGYSQIEVYHPETEEVYGVLILTEEGEMVYSERPFQDGGWKKRLCKFLISKIMKKAINTILYETIPDNQRFPGSN